MRAKALAQTWKTYPPRERKMIEARLQERDRPRRFHPRVQHTQESLYYSRIQRLATAILRA